MEDNKVGLNDLAVYCGKIIEKLGIDISDQDILNQFATLFYLGYYYKNPSSIPPIVEINLSCGRMDRLVTLKTPLEKRLENLGYDLEELDRDNPYNPV